MKVTHQVSDAVPDTPGTDLGLLTYDTGHMDGYWSLLVLSHGGQVKGCFPLFIGLSDPVTCGRTNPNFPQTAGWLAA